MSGDLCYRMLPPILILATSLVLALVVNIVAGRARALTHGSALSDGRRVPREAGQHWSDHRGQIELTQK